MRQGIGRALIDDALAALAADGIRDLWVTANQHAMTFYVAMGFKAIESAATPLGSGIRMKLRHDATGGSPDWPAEPTDLV